MFVSLCIGDMAEKGMHVHTYVLTYTYIRTELYDSDC